MTVEGGAGARPRAAAVVATLVGAIAAVACLVVPPAVRGELVLALVAVSGPLVALSVRRHGPRRRLQWLCVALAGVSLAATQVAALLGWGLGNALAHLAMYASLAVAAHVAVGKGRQHSSVLGLDIAVVAVAGAAVGLWLHDVVPSPPPAWVVVPVAGDLVLVAYLLALLLYGVRITAPVRLVGGALGLLLVHHAVLWTTGVTAAASSRWSVLLVGIATLTVTASWHPAMGTFGDVASPLSPPRRLAAGTVTVALALPVLVLLSTVGVLPDPGGAPQAVLAGAVVATTLLVVASLVLASAEERRLLDTDPLTRAGSRLALRQVLSTQIHRGTFPVRLCVVDLDDVGALALRQGRQTADAALVERVRWLQEALPDAVVCRIGAQTLAVLVSTSRVRRESPAPLAFVASVQAALAGPGHDATGARTTAAVLTVPPRPQESYQGLTTDEVVDRLLEHAELSLLEAHDRGGPVEADVDRNGKYARARRLDTELAAAIGTPQIAVHYQPLVDPCSGRTRSLEALVRWEHPDLGLVAPEDFLAAADLQGLGGDIDDLARRQALADFAGWEAAGCAPDHVAVNLSAASLACPQLVHRVSADLQEAGVAPHRLVLEVVEQQELPDVQAVAGRLEQLHELGVGVAVDDFGVGHAALQYLLLFPVDVVKLDRSLVAEVGSRYGRALLGSAVTMVGSLGALAVAEGVEEEEQMRAVAELGFALAQGFYCGRPLPAGPTGERLMAERQQTVAGQDGSPVAALATPADVRGSSPS